MAFLGCSIVFAMVLYLVDKNQVWQQFFNIARVVALIVSTIVIVMYSVWMVRALDASASSVLVSGYNLVALALTIVAGCFVVWTFRSIVKFWS